MDVWNVQNQYKVKMKPLLATAYGVATENVSRYANPSDCDSLYSVSILDILVASFDNVVSDDCVNCSLIDGRSECGVSVRR